MGALVFAVRIGRARIDELAAAGTRRIEAILAARTGKGRYRGPSRRNWGRRGSGRPRARRWAGEGSARVRRPVGWRRAARRPGPGSWALQAGSLSRRGARRRYRPTAKSCVVRWAAWAPGLDGVVLIPRAARPVRLWVRVGPRVAGLAAGGGICGGAKDGGGSGAALGTRAADGAPFEAATGSFGAAPGAGIHASGGHGDSAVRRGRRRGRSHGRRRGNGSGRGRRDGRSGARGREGGPGVRSRGRRRRDVGRRPARRCGIGLRPGRGRGGLGQGEGATPADVAPVAGGASSAAAGTAGTGSEAAGAA